MTTLGLSVLLGTGVLALSAPAGSADAPVQHVIEATELSVSSSTPLEGEVVTFRFRIGNTGKTVATQIPWVLQIDGQIIGNGNVSRLSPGESVESAKGWNAERGMHSVSFIIDPAGVGQAVGAPRGKRVKQLVVNVAAAADSTSSRVKSGG